MKIFGEINKLLGYACQNLGLHCDDVNYTRNTLLDALSLPSYDPDVADLLPNVDCSVDELIASFVATGVQEEVFSAPDAPAMVDKVMGILSMRPSQINDEFHKILAEEGAQAATTWFYDYCVANSYVKKSVLDKNPRFVSNGLVVTINCAKPEFRDPKKAKSGNSVAGGYPRCVICRQNEGFAPRGKGTLRTVSLNLNGDEWFWQFSPFGYFYQHGIVVNTKHVPMHVEEDTFRNLIAFVDQFPHYFVGCNASLERIGGSVLAHDHYQGGRETLPLHNAGIAKFFTLPECPDVTVGILDWSGSVVRVSGYNKQSVIKASMLIRNAWKIYNNPDLGIICGENGVSYHEVSPTVIKNHGCYEMNVILRSNVTSAQYPDGVFHAHPEYHVIKKESIGLIEAQGLFILPGRLVDELDRLENVVVNGGELPVDLAEFHNVLDWLKQATTATDKDSVHMAMQSVLGDICQNILKNTAVFKNIDDFAAFLKGLGFEENNYTHRVTAAGRINIIGEHIDYQGGKVLPAALSLKNTVYIRPNGTDKINLAWTTLPDKVSLDTNDLLSYADSKVGNYQAGCAFLWKHAGHKLVGCDILSDCSVPFGSGLSSSAAIEVSTLAALATVAGEPINKKEIALLAQQAERQFAHVNCGVMDQYASANGLKDHALLLDCDSVTHTYVPIRLGEYAFVVANCNKPHSLVTSKYNERRAETDLALEQVQRILDVSCLAQLDYNKFDDYSHVWTDATVLDRAKHIVGECNRVNLAVEAMSSGDMATLGALLNQSHQSLQQLYEVSCVELDTLVYAAQAHPDCLGARMVGGGFGGCIIALVKASGVESFKTKVGNTYKKTIGYEATFYDVQVADGITVKNLK